jgi:hypothetical protein
VALLVGVVSGSVPAIRYAVIGTSVSGGWKGLPLSPRSPKVWRPFILSAERKTKTDIASPE